MLKLIDSIVYIITYLGCFLGVWLILYPIISRLVNRIRVYTRFRISRIQRKSKIFNCKLFSHIELLLSVTLNIKTTYSIITFCVISVFLIGTSLVFLLNSEISIFICLIISTIFGLFPYMILRIRLHNIRVNSSYEGTILISELINQYKINYFNMIEAVDETIPRLDKQLYSKKALFRFSLAVKQYCGNEELEEIINEFNYSINTSWSLLLANNIYLSIDKGDDVREALNDILEDLSDLKKINEKNKQYNHETYVMIKFIAPSFYILSIFAMFGIFGFTIDKFIDFQFNNPTGLKFFLLIILSISINYIIYFVIRKPKNDF